MLRCWNNRKIGLVGLPYCQADIMQLLNVSMNDKSDTLGMNF